MGNTEVELTEWAHLRAERQAWLVCRDEADRQTRRWFDVVTRIGRAGMGFRTAGHGTDLVNEARSERLSAMQFATKDLIPRLSDAERTELRVRRVLPDWFVPEMLRLARPIERELRRP